MRRPPRLRLLRRHIRALKKGAFDMRLLIRLAVVAAATLALSPMIPAGAARAPAPRPDLSMTVTFNSPSSYESIYIQVVVHNRGAADATGVSVTHTGIANLTSWWPCAAGEPRTCMPGTI